MSERASELPTLRQLTGRDLISLEEAFMVLDWNVTYKGVERDVTCCGEPVDIFFDSAGCVKCNKFLFNLAGIYPAGRSSVGIIEDDKFFDDGVTWYIQYGRGS